MKSRTPDSCFRERTVARTLDTFSGSPECNQGGNVVVFDARGNGDGQIVPTITGDHENRVTDYTALAVGNGQLNQIYMTDTAGTLTCSHDQQMICAFMGGQGAKAGESATRKRYRQRSKPLQAGTTRCPTLPIVKKKARRYFVRRFTPLECCRLQGFPDWWEAGVSGSDSARYKMGVTAWRCMRAICDGGIRCRRITAYFQAHPSSGQRRRLCLTSWTQSSTLISIHAARTRTQNARSTSQRRRMASHRIEG